MASDERMRQEIGSVLERDREETDDTLRLEREQTDTRAAQISGDKAEPQLRADVAQGAAREPAPDALPEVADTLVGAAEELAEVAAGLTRVAQKLKDAGEAGAMETLHHVARDLEETAVKVTGDGKAAASAAPGPAHSPEPAVAGTLASVAESLGAVAATLAEERVRTDATLREERARLDDTLEDERRALEDEREEQSRLLEEERRKTDDNLEKERADTDQAIEQALGLLGEEEEAHESARDMVVTREEFLAIVSHDLRTPLSVIVMSAAMIKERAATVAAAEDLVHAADRIQRSADQMGRMLSDLLDATRFQHGQFRLSPRPGDATETVKECAAAFDAIARSHGVFLRLDVPEARVQARFDHDRILQVLSNLVRNALQFTGSGGRVTLGVVPLSPGCRIDVGDTGSGIPTADLQRIFDRFHQLANAGRNGLGLGLYISRAIVEAHGGTIWADSKEGQGSTFSFTLPV